MRYCKLLKEDNSKIVPVIRENFELATNLSKKYYQGNNGNKKPYALCPACDNPVVIVGFYSKNDEHTKKQTQHARHTKKSLVGFPLYNQQEYDLCPYANPKSYSKGDYKTTEKDALSREIKSLLIANFDKVVYFLEKEMGIIYSDKDLENMLENYFSMDGTNYIGATLENYPWTFLYLSLNQRLFGKIFLKDGFMYSRIIRNCKNITFEALATNTYAENKYVKLLTKQFTDITCSFIGHNSKPQEGEIIERLKLCIWQDEKLIYTKEITLNNDYFFNIANLDTWKITERGKRHLEIARKFK